jgi:F-type H+-transporting ATPase subunit delta
MGAVQTTAAKRYAKALWSPASSGPVAVKAEEILAAVSKNLAENKELKFLLESPGFSNEKKWSVLSSLLDNYQAPKELKSFFRVVLDAGRILILGEITEQYRMLRLSSEGSAEALVESAQALSGDEERGVAETIQKRFGLKALLKTRINPALVAGLRVHVGGKTLDNTFISKIEKLKKELLETNAG